MKHNGKSAGLVSRHEPTVAYDVCGKDGHKPVLRSPVIRSVQSKGGSTQGAHSDNLEQELGVSVDFWKWRALAFDEVIPASPVYRALKTRSS